MDQNWYQRFHCENLTLRYFHIDIKYEVILCHYLVFRDLRRNSGTTTKQIINNGFACGGIVYVGSAGCLTTECRSQYQESVMKGDFGSCNLEVM
jgi:hypothetical protein